jgi:transcriptional regulator with XRE-family HTH domain
MIAMVEKRRRVPTVDTVARICRAFGVSAGMVWFEAEERLGQARCNRGCNYSYITPCGRFVVISPPCRSR